MRTFASKELFLKLLNYHGRITSYLDEIVHLILFTSTIFVNKYVLSILKFTYPTVFQGWQTLVGVVILKFLIWKAKAKLEVTPLDRKGTINMLPHLLFYVGSIVAGSKALASLPIPVFLSACNLAPASVCLLDHLPGLCSLSSLFTLLPAAIALISSAFVLLLCDAETSEVPLGGESPYFWMLVHVVLITAQSLHDRVADPRFSAMDRLYYANLFGLVILAPASLYLEEAFLALQFRHRRQIHFYIGCVLSGVLGLLLRMHLVAANFPKHAACNIVNFQVSSLSREKGVEEDTSTCGDRCRLSCVAVAAVLASALSLVTFPRGALEVGVATSVTTSLVAALFVCPLDCSVDNSCSRGGREEEEVPGGGREGVVKLPPAEEMQKAVMAVFWVVFTYNRQLIFPAELDVFVPTWFNHCLHTNIVLFASGELLICRRPFVNRRSRFAFGLAVMMLYNATLVFSYHWQGFWTYPMFGMMTETQRIVFYCCMHLTYISTYAIGSKANGLVCGTKKLKKN